MRKIKFRMWDTLEKNFMNHSRVIESRVLALENNGEERFIFQQWTGLFDRHGKEIYEGDIIREVYEDCPDVGFVHFDDGMFVVSFPNSHDYCLSGCDLDDTEIIGNIYDNPELISS